MRAVGKWLCTCVLMLAAFHPGSVLAADASLRTIVLLDFELIDGTLDRASDEAQRARLKTISDALRDEFIARRFYTVLDNKPAQALIADLESRFKLYDCNGCDTDIGKALGADRTLTGWVQKVSNLILNINIQIRDVQSGLIVLTRSVDIRGNTDVSWLRGIHYMARSMEEKQQGNR